MLEPGTVVDRYEIVEPIAGGGMGVVYRARHTKLGKEVAFKELLSNLALSEKVQTRFQQEAYVQANLSHANIVNVSDFITEGSLLAIVMELVDGPSLEQVLADEQQGPWTIEQTMAVMKPVLDALAYAHARGVVHRDIKPGNVLLDRPPGVKGLGKPKVSDFGLAKILSSEVGMTKTGARMGTVPYMAPEQFRGSKAIDARADVFALGMMVWRLLAGRLPIEPDDLMAAAELYAGRTDVPRIGDVASGVPDAVSEAVYSALSVEPSARPADARELLRRLERDRVVPATFPKVEGETQPKKPAAKVPVEVVGPASDSEIVAAEPFDGRRLGVLVGIPVVGVVLLLAVTGVFGGKENSDVPAGVASSQSAEVSGGSAIEHIPTEVEPPDGFVLIPAGTFTMGSPSSESGRDNDETQHQVTLTRDFFVQAHEVTQSEWRVSMGNNPSYFTSCGDTCPVENVNWYEAVAYANALSRQEGLEACYDVSGETGTLGGGCGGERWCDGDFAYANVDFAGLDCEGYRLPTEAEWEYAARAGTTTSRYCGSSESCLDGIAWYRDNSLETAHRVGGKDSNEWGLYDVLGNVWEWCWDRYGDYPRGSVTDSLGPTSGSYRVIRGGSWINFAWTARAANRGYRGPGIRNFILGFRLARSTP